MAITISGQILDFCVLAIIDRKETYGYALTQSLAKSIQLSESTLYPVLRRLRKNGFLRTFDQAHEGRNRRYYQITDKGKKELTRMKDEWRVYVQAVEAIVEGENIT